MAAATTLYFDPDLHPDDTLQSFNEFIQRFELRYDAQYPDPPKVSLDAAIEDWKLEHDDAKPFVDEYDNIRAEWRSCGETSRHILIQTTLADWKVAEKDETTRTKANWEYFVQKCKVITNPLRISRQSIINFDH